jgi:hypothetical protein
MSNWMMEETPKGQFVEVVVHIKETMFDIERYEIEIWTDSSGWESTDPEHIIRWMYIPK